MYCLSLHYPVRHTSLIAFTNFARKRERTHLRWAVSKSPSPNNLQTPWKGLCRSQGFSSSSVGSSCALAWCSVSAVPAATHSTVGMPPASPLISADRAWALCIPQCLWVSGELAERRAPLRMLQNRPHLQSWLSMNESCFVWCTLATPGISLYLRMKTSMMIFSSLW